MGPRALSNEEYCDLRGGLAHKPASYIQQFYWNSHLLNYISSVAAPMMAELNSRDGDHKACHAQTTYHQALYKESLPSLPQGLHLHLTPSGRLYLLPFRSPAPGEWVSPGSSLPSTFPPPPPCQLQPEQALEVAFTQGGRCIWSRNLALRTPASALCGQFFAQDICHLPSQ